MAMKGSRRNRASGSRVGIVPGPWGILLISLVAMSTTGPRMSAHLGDFWGMAAFLPAWVLFFPLIHKIRIWTEARHEKG